MTFRTRLLVTFLLTVLLPIIALALFIRVEMTNRLTAQYERRVDALVNVLEEDLGAESAAIAKSLAVIRSAMRDDNRFRRAAVDRIPEDRRYLLNYAGDAMQLTRLSMFQIQDESGRIISSGHFRNEFDRLEPELPRLLASAPDGTALVQARSPDKRFLALARVDSLRMGSRSFALVAGIRVERRFLDRLEREAGLTVALVYPEGVLTSGETSAGASPQVASAHAIVRELSVPFIDADRGDRLTATFRVTHELTELAELRRSVDRWFLVAVAVAGVLAVLIVSWLASRISRPLADLADKTSRIDLDRLDLDFRTQRKDEIGMLSRLLGAMTDRLRTSAAAIKDAERRATLGELARQVNHDIKNGLTPIRNVFRHLAQSARDEPTQLPDVFQERENTLDSSIAYLEKLASNYARLSPKRARQSCDVNEIVGQVVKNRRSQRARVETSLGDGVVVTGDPMAIRRILENLIDNAIDSLDNAGTVRVTTAVHGDDERPVRIEVTDTGCGMTDEQRTQVFDDFYTTKEDGTGLGLSIVRRLVMDLDGSIDVESEPNKGSRFVIELPAVERHEKHTG